MARTKLEEKQEPPKIIDHNQCFEGDLLITFPLQDSQQPPILTKLNEKVRQRNNVKINFQIEKSKYDKSGEQYKELTNCVYFDPEAHKKLFGLNDLDKKKYDLIKIDEDGSIYIDSLIYSARSYEQSYKYSKIKLSRSNSYHHRKFIRVPKKDNESVENNFISKLMPDSDIKNYDKVKFKIGSYSVFDGPKGSPFIPSYKKICFSTLKQLFSIDKENTLKKIKSLPFDLKEQFIEYCLLEDRPIGYLIIWELYNDKDAISKDEKEKLFTLNVLIGSALKKDDWLRNNFEMKVEDDVYISGNNSKINVYDNYELFKFKELSSESEIRHRLFKSDVKSKDLIDGSPSIVPKEEFLANFHRETRGLFKDEHGNTPKGFLFIGGLITSCLTGQTQGFESSDIDVLMLNDPNESFNSSYIEKVKNIFGEDYEDNGYSIHAMGGHVVFSLQYPNRTVQFNIYQFSDINEVLLGVDIDCSCFAFDGTNVWTLERGLLAINHRINIASQFSYKIRGGDQYQRRLLKYLSRGYDIHYNNTPAIQDIIDHFNTEDKSTMSEYMSGFQLLLAAKYNKEIETILNQSTKDRSLPYGPQWKKKNFDHYMKECFETIFDGYSSSGVFCPVESIDDLFQFLESTKESLAIEDNNWDIPTLPQEFSILLLEKEEEDERFSDLPPIENFFNLNVEKTFVTSKILKTE
ncbi:hypothetical protein ACTFIZ_001060 [Dictyostelium cf. discoideum]